MCQLSSKNLTPFSAGYLKLFWHQVDVFDRSAGKEVAGVLFECL